jgi:hypothetical protein
MAKAEKKTASLSDNLDALNAALRENGKSVSDLLVAMAHKEYGLDLRRVIHPLEAPKE